jgi:prepilin-type N-terminal cleavage/methylation domain-containing protein
MRFPPRPSRRTGFTLLELMVVVVILAVMATLVVPRFTASTRRSFDLAVDQVADLLVVFAQRDNVGSAPVGLQLDPERRRLSVMVLHRLDDDGNTAEWRTDALVPPVTLLDVLDLDALVVYADGEPVDVRTYPLAQTPGEDRPTIEIALRTHDEEHATMLRLLPHGVAPERLESLAFASRTPIDLDGAGRSREDW